MEFNEQNKVADIPDKTEQEIVREAVKPETATTETVTIGDKDIRILPLKRRWQHLFFQAAWPLFKVELAMMETVQKAFTDGTIDFVNISDHIVNGEMESDNSLDRAAAVILASKVPGAEKDAEKIVKEQIEWLQDNARTEEMRDLVEKQAEKERMIVGVGERFPARFARSLHLAGRTELTPDMVKQHLTNYLRKSQAQIGNGN